MSRSRFFIIAAYVVVFWLLLPAAIVVPGLILDPKLGLRLPATWPVFALGSIIALIAAWGLASAIRQFHSQSGRLPISAMPPDRVIQHRLFSVWRHPIYLFYALLFIGIGLVLRSGAMLLFMLPALIAAEAFYIVLEERALVKRFGTEFTDYRRRTPLLVPRLHECIKPLPYVLFRLLFGYRVVGSEHIPARGPFFMVAAHRCYLDPFFAWITLGHPVRFVTTYEVFRRPLSAFVFRRLLSIPKKRYLTDVSTGRGIAQSLREGWSIGVFPEGERSWTGRTQPWKPEAVSLLRRYPGVPILPIRLDGNYLAWPRWGSAARRARVRVTILPPVHLAPGVTHKEAERTLRALVEPDDSGWVCRSGSRSLDIGKVLYRCPVCRAFDSLVPARGPRFSCSSCSTGFEIAPDYRIRYQAGHTNKVKTIPELYDMVRISDADLGPGDMRALATCEPVAFAEEQGTELVETLSGRFSLFADRIEVADAGKRKSAALADVRSVTTESNRKLQVFDGRARRLYQLTFKGESVLKWQDWIVTAMLHIGLAPNTR